MVMMNIHSEVEDIFFFSLSKLYTIPKVKLENFIKMSLGNKRNRNINNKRNKRIFKEI